MSLIYANLHKNNQKWPKMTISAFIFFVCLKLRQI